MQRVTVERAGANRPALFHAYACTRESGLLRGGQNAATSNRNEACYRLALAGNDIFFTGFNLAYTARKSLVGLAQAYSLAHNRRTGLMLRYKCSAWEYYLQATARFFLDGPPFAL